MWLSGYTKFNFFGEKITIEFVEFCNKEVITLDDVINDNYTESDIGVLDTAQRYATTMTLIQVDAENLEKVIKFVRLLGEKFVRIL